MQVHLSKDSDDLSFAVAEWMTSLIETTLQQQVRFCWLLAGGSTPENLYKLLACDPFNKRIDWLRVHIFFGDERSVPFDDERNNGKMAHDALISKVPIPAAQVHYINTNRAPQFAAADYARLLRQHFNDSSYSFDLALLGLGEDGHTLSIFPGCESLTQTESWVVAINVPSKSEYRISLVPRVVNRSRSIAFLVSGRSKSLVLNEILHNKAASHSYPAQLIHPSNGELHWFVDNAAFGA